MIEPRSTRTPSRSGQGLRPVHAVVVGLSVVVAAVVAFAVLSSIVGILAFFVKLVVVVAIIGFVVRLVMRHAGGRS